MLRRLLREEIGEAGVAYAVTALVVAIACIAALDAFVSR